MSSMCSESRFFEDIKMECPAAYAGLPGLAWQRGESVFLEGLGSSTGFLRSESAVKSGIDRGGLALPCASPHGEAHGHSHVLAFFSSSAAPLAERVECWAPDANLKTLQRQLAFDSAGGPSLAETSLPLQAGSNLIADADLSGVPVLRESPGEAGHALVAIPIVNEGRIVETVALYFS